MTTPPDPVSIKVTRIGSRYHARLFHNGELYSEMACSLRVDIGWICRELCRWYDKCGGMSLLAHSARGRQHRGPHGQVWYPAHLPTTRRKKQ